MQGCGTHTRRELVTKGAGKTKGPRFGGKGTLVRVWAGTGTAAVDGTVQSRVLPPGSRHKCWEGAPAGHPEKVSSTIPHRFILYFHMA